MKSIAYGIGVCLEYEVTSFDDQALEVTPGLRVRFSYPPQVKSESSIQTQPQSRNTGTSFREIHKISRHNNDEIRLADGTGLPISTSQALIREIREIMQLPLRKLLQIELQTSRYPRKCKPRLA